MYLMKKLAVNHCNQSSSSYLFYQKFLEEGRTHWKGFTEEAQVRYEIKKTTRKNFSAKINSSCKQDPGYLNFVTSKKLLFNETNCVPKCPFENEAELDDKVNLEDLAHFLNKVNKKIFFFVLNKFILSLISFILAL